jgi:alkylation response protein AidB-like acyl-CoA dehydrogenase
MDEAGDHDRSTAIRSAFGRMVKNAVGARRAIGLADEGRSDERVWQQLCAMGAHTATLTPDAGGEGASIADAAVVAEELGRHLVVVPYADTVASTRLLADAGQHDLLHRLAVGEVCSDAGAVSRREGQRVRIAPYGGVSSYVIAVEEGGATVWPLSQAGRPLEPVENLGHFPMVMVPDGLPAGAPLQVDRETVHRYRADRLCLTSVAIMAAARELFDRTVAHVKDRHQFGRAIGSFQVVQHRLVDTRIEMTGAALLVDSAVRAAERPAEAYLRAASLAFEAGAGAAQRAVKSAVQLFGGYGYTLDSDVHLYLRYIKTLVVTGGAAERQLRLRSLAAPPAEARAPHPFRLEVEEFLRAHLDPGTTRPHTDTHHDRTFHEAVARRGWVGMTWPRAYGGSGLGPDELSIYWELVHYHEAPADAQMTTEMVGQVILERGTEEQRRRFLPAMTAGSCIAALGYTEADAGSDLAGVKTRADLAPGGYVINGSKLFTTHAHHADYVLLLARTDVAASRHAGLSLFLVPLADPGIEVHPILTLGGSRTNATFYSDVFVPDDLRIGAERMLLGGLVGELRRTIDDLTGALGELDMVADEHVQAAVGSMRVRVESAAALCDHLYARVRSGADISVPAAMTKVAISETIREICYEALDLIGPLSLATGASRLAVASGHLEYMFRHAQVLPVWAGANEVQRDLIARRGLGLPRA